MQFEELFTKHPLCANPWISFLILTALCEVHIIAALRKIHVSMRLSKHAEQVSPLFRSSNFKPSILFTKILSSLPALI